MEQRNFFKPRDLLVVLVILLAAAAIGIVMMLQNKDKTETYAMVLYRGGIAETVDLNRDGKFYISDLPQVEFEVRDGAVAFIHSDCPDQICVNTGWLSRPGHTAACLPNEVLLIVDGEVN